MTRRSLFSLIAGALAAPFLPKSKYECGLWDSHRQCWTETTWAGSDTSTWVRGETFVTSGFAGYQYDYSTGKLTELPNARQV